MSKFLDYLENTHGISEHLLGFLKIVGFDVAPAFIQVFYFFHYLFSFLKTTKFIFFQAFSLPDSNLGLSSATYNPDKSLLGTRNAEVKYFEETVDQLASVQAKRAYFGLTGAEPDIPFLLKPGHLRSFQLIGTEFRSKNPLPNLKRTPSEITFAQQPTVAEKILQKFSKKFDVETMSGLKIDFKANQAYVACPSCNNLYKITQRKNKSGVTFAIFDAEKHIKMCVSGAGRKQQKEKDNTPEAEDVLEKIE